MAPQSIAERVVKLEEQMASLQELPKRVDDLAMQVSQLRTEMRGEFSAIRGEMATESFAFRAEIGDLARQMRVLHEDLVGRIALIQEGLGGAKRKSAKPRRPR